MPGAELYALHILMYFVPPATHFIDGEIQAYIYRNTFRNLHKSNDRKWQGWI
jgi:hypothetical protein